MINKPDLVIIAAAAAMGVTSPAPAKSIRDVGSLLHMMVWRFYDARMQTVQMRLAPTRRLGVRDHRLP